MGLDMYLEADGKEIGYWRKANAIHLWFVKNVQNGNDDCEQYPVTKEQLTTLRDTCQKVIDSSKLIPGKVQNGSHCGLETGGKWEKIYEEGQIVEDPTVAIELLPTRSGFFFGDTNFDERYINQLKETIRVCNLALTLNNITYQSSW